MKKVLSLFAVALFTVATSNAVFATEEKKASPATMETMETEETETATTAATPEPKSFEAAGEGRVSSASAQVAPVDTDAICDWFGDCF